MVMVVMVVRLSREGPFRRGPVFRCVDAEIDRSAGIG